MDIFYSGNVVADKLKIEKEVALRIWIINGVYVIWMGPF